MLSTTHLANLPGGHHAMTTECHIAQPRHRPHKQAGDENVIILGAAGRDFHDFMTYWSTAPHVQVKCFTGTQIPGIDQRVFPKELCNNETNNNRYPNGIPIRPERELESLIKMHAVDTCALAYSDLSYDTVQSLAARVTAAGAKFVQLAPKATMIPSIKPVISVCASRTGVGKSQTSRYIAKYFKNKGIRVAAVRHPMPYDQNLLKQRCQRYERLSDMDKYECTIEEREEYYRHIEAGTLLFAGVDYLTILHEAEQDADIVLWDGGNNDFSFYKPDLTITLVDSLRPLDETRYFPGGTNVRMADAIMVSKVNSLKDLEPARLHAEHLKSITKPDTPFFFGQSIVKPEGKDPVTGQPVSLEMAQKMVHGKRVLVVDDGPTLTHGGMAFGAGYVLAQQLGASEIVDPRPYAKGSLVAVFEKFQHLVNVLPAMGYDAQQIKDLEGTIQATPCDAVIIGTPSDITHLIDFSGRPAIMTSYELELIPEHQQAFDELLDSVFTRFTMHQQKEN